MKEKETVTIGSSLSRFWTEGTVQGLDKSVVRQAGVGAGVQG